MSRVLLDERGRATLKGLAEELEICDEAGRTLGHFLPEPVYQRLIYRLAEAQRPTLSTEERERRRKELGGRPLQEILKELGAV